MSADRLQAVRARYGEPLPAGLGALTDAELDDLATALVEADRMQSSAVDHSIDQALRYLPWPLSAVVRKVLLG
jgi:hypothetical protein